MDSSTNLYQLIESVSNEQSISLSELENIILSSVTNAVQKEVGSKSSIKARFVKKKLEIVRCWTIVSSRKKHLSESEITLSQVACKTNKKLKVGMTFEEQIDLTQFKRISSSLGRKTIQSALQRLKAEHMLNEIRPFIGKIISAIIYHVSVTHVEVEIVPYSIRCVIKRSEFLQTDSIHTQDILKFVLLDAWISEQNNLITKMTRNGTKMIKALLESEIGEIADGTIIIKHITRSNCIRTKVALSSTRKDIDPCALCIGFQGKVIGNIVKEINYEQLDIIPWVADKGQFALNALSLQCPVEHIIYRTDTKKMILSIDSMHMAKVIGHRGTNVYLAQKMTGCSYHLKTMKEWHQQEEDTVIIKMCQYFNLELATVKKVIKNRSRSLIYILLHLVKTGHIEKQKAGLYLVISALETLSNRKKELMLLKSIDKKHLGVLLQHPQTKSISHVAKLPLSGLKTILCVDDNTSRNIIMEARAFCAQNEKK